MEITEEDRLKGFEKHDIPKKYQDLYLSILYEDKRLVPKEYLKKEIKDKRFPIDVKKIKKAKDELIILLALALCKEVKDE